MSGARADAADASDADASAPVVPAPWLPRGLADAVAAAGERLARLGVRAGERVVLDTPTRARWAVLPYLLAADRLGAASLVADAGWTVRERDAVLADTAPHHVVGTDGGAATGPGGPRTPGVFLLPTTSGSTGGPAVLARDRRSWRLGFDALGALPGPVLVPGPPSSTLYLFGALHALHHGLGLDTRGRLDPADLPDGGTVHVVPAQLGALLDDRERRPGGPVPRVVVCGGAHVAPAVRERCARLLPGTTLLEYYGSAEHSLIATRRDDGPLRAVEDVRLTVRDGLLWVDSPQSVLGRFGAGVLHPSGPGPTTVGDRAELTADGGLIVLGRAAATVSTGGTLVAAEEVEQVLRAVPGVTDVVVAGTPHATLGMLVTAVVEARDGGPDRRALRAAARDGLSPAKRPRRWLLTRALPRLGSGQPARAEIAGGLRDGTLDAVPLGEPE
ncbi:AMP-binding enzyme [Pseudonocardia spirodelae]|uniref:AMP-binding enzyme C-terminal domain-containing protein n=1 Tax=Pseudonocardia spirodelae TaxID=3133431 RepID=A0ABU8T452_9PSEU